MKQTKPIRTRLFQTLEIPLFWGLPTGLFSSRAHKIVCVCVCVELSPLPRMLHTLPLSSSLTFRAELIYLRFWNTLSLNNVRNRCSNKRFWPIPVSEYLSIRNRYGMLKQKRVMNLQKGCSVSICGVKQSKWHRSAYRYGYNIYCILTENQVAQGWRA